jgi:hypothetical protein
MTLYENALYGNNVMGMHRIDLNQLLDSQRKMMLILQGIDSSEQVVTLYENALYGNHVMGMHRADLNQLLDSQRKMMLILQGIDSGDTLRKRIVRQTCNGNASRRFESTVGQSTKDDAYPIGD